MAYSRPGGPQITERGLEMAGLKKGCRILDIGCGEGDSIVWLNEEKGMKAEGIDINLARIAEAKEQHPGIDVKYGDGEFLDEYMSFTFDAVLMEGCLSQINMPDEALHEAWCVLKKGGKLIISDVYEKDPNRGQMRAVRIEADRQSRIPHQEGDCENRGLKFVDFRFEGAFYQQPLIRQMEEIGYHILGFEDHSEELEAFLDEKAAAGTEREEALTQINRYLKAEAGGVKRDIGYFLLAAAKPL